MGNGFVIAFAEDALTQNTIVGYWDGRTITETADNAALQTADTFIDGELEETALMNLFGNVQIAHPDKYAMLKRVTVSVALV